LNGNIQLKRLLNKLGPKAKLVGEISINTLPALWSFPQLFYFT